MAENQENNGKFFSPEVERIIHGSSPEAPLPRGPNLETALKKMPEQALAATRQIIVKIRENLVGK